MAGREVGGAESARSDLFQGRAWIIDSSGVDGDVLLVARELIAALGAVAWQLWRTIKRIDRHARSIAHMDEWADVVDQCLTSIDERTRRAPPPAAPAPRSAVDFKKWGQK